MQRRTRIPAFVLLIWVHAFALFAPRPALAQSPDNVLIVVNAAVPDSLQIGEYYQRKRRIPTEHLLRIKAPADEQITREVFEQQIEGPVSGWIARRRAHDRLLYIVLTKGVPLRVAGTGGRAGTVASVDSELALLYRRMVGNAVVPAGPIPNPYFLGNRPVAEARRFTHERHDIYLVTRLDGYTVADAIALIDRGSAPGRDGRVILDARGSLMSEAGNRWLERAAEQLRGLGLEERVLLDTSGDVVRDQSDVLGYYSWGSNDPAMKTRQNGLVFAPGAIAASFVSTDGRTFKEPPAQWTYGRWEAPTSFFGGSPQSLIGDLIRQGVTGVAGHVAEPFLDATIRPDVLFPAYFSGFTLAEAFYLAMPSLSWQTIVVGDPLAAPFPRAALEASSIDPGFEPSSELPAWFAARATKAGVLQSRPTESAALFLRAQSRVIREDMAGAIEALEEATTKNPKFIEGEMMLGALYQRAGDEAKALDRYRRTIALSPGHSTALNNLAFALATAPQATPEARAEALVLARRAVASAPRTPAVLDTLAWVYYLSGDVASARPPINLAIQLAPRNAELLLHGAIIDAAAGDLVLARTRLDRALAADPSLESNPDVQQLRAKLPTSPAPARGSVAGRGTSAPARGGGPATGTAPTQGK
jgi:uncharacterized protein (TIGR03790 family)